ncbi:hypothetical protein JHK85_010853 [Glycine max]|nr:hypothetical protein JHK85_010853 [Glycine max]
MGENITALVAMAATDTRTSMRVAPQLKKCPMQKEKCLHAPITLLGYTWIDGESDVTSLVELPFDDFLAIRASYPKRGFNATSSEWVGLHAGVLCVHQFLTLTYAFIMTQANANMNAFFLACRNRIVVGKGPLNPHLNRTSGPSDAPTDVVPPPGKDPKGKHKHNKRSHCDHQSGSGKAFGHKERSSREKKVKQQMLEFQPSTTTTLANFSTLTNQGLFVKDFQLDRFGFGPTSVGVLECRCLEGLAGVFGINKDVYYGELMLIDDISKDATLTLERLMTPTKDFQDNGVGAEDEDHFNLSRGRYLEGTVNKYSSSTLAEEYTREGTISHEVQP